ncbi:conserved hypothetical protein [Mesorhizobium plurifarium]|uniref:Uncharacterized protein n=1 Tax=Mesorhizobium plurifarium TaxID=69974 RepID=A0A090F2Q5_MESPL|nr:conserved hypothetical protein [Mesorhizobium plurifarium]
MVHTGHRLSKDIDAFIDDPQYLSVLSPRLGGEGAWDHQAYDEAPNYLKLIYPEGEIDFIVASYITNVPTERKIIGGSGLSEGLSHSIEIEHPVEIALKKLNYRGPLLKVRDVFDIAVVDYLFSDLLQDNLHFVSHLKAAIGIRLINLQEDYVRNELGELNIAEEWRPIADICLDRMREIAEAIPDPKSTP